MATKTKEPTRIEELASKLDAHHAEVAGIESKATDLDEQAQRAEDRARATLADFRRPAEGLAEDVRALKDTAQRYREGAELLRQRAVAYRAEFQLDGLEAEHRMLVMQETEHHAAERALAQHGELVAEWETRLADLRERYLASEAIAWRLNFLADSIAALSQRHGLSLPPRMVFAVNDIHLEVRTQIKRASSDAHRAEIMAHLPKLDA